MLGAGSPKVVVHHARLDHREALDGIVVDQDGPGVDAPSATDRDDLPFATCELGGGMHVAYHRRPLVSPEDVAALALAKIGSGSVWQGYYMYAGGTQRVGPSGTEQESQATGYPNDVPTRTYDFFAPVGEHVPLALRAVDRGGTVVCAGIHMSDIPAFPYRLLWEERVVRSVANLTRQDGEEFLALAPRVPVRTLVARQR